MEAAIFGMQILLAAQLAGGNGCMFVGCGNSENFVHDSPK